MPTPPASDFPARRRRPPFSAPRLPQANHAWWINRKDGDGHNIFEGSFLGLDNISVFDRSQPLPPGFSLKQADATGWMAMFTLNMTVMALELATEDSDYESIAIQTFTRSWRSPTRSAAISMAAFRYGTPRPGSSRI